VSARWVAHGVQRTSPAYGYIMTDDCTVQCRRIESSSYFVAALVCCSACLLQLMCLLRQRVWLLLVAQREIPAAGMGAESIVVHLAVVTGLGAAFVGAQAYAAALDAFLFTLLVLAQPPPATLSVKNICVHIYIS